MTNQARPSVRRAARPLLLTAAVMAVLGPTAATTASAASPPERGLHNLAVRSYFFERPGVAVRGTLFATELFDVTRVSRTGTWAQGHPWGMRSEVAWVAVDALRRTAPVASRGMTEVAGPAGSRVFRPAQTLRCRETNALTVGVRLRGARSARVTVLRGGDVVGRSRELFGTGLTVDRVRVPCGGAATVRYTVDGRVRNFAVEVDSGI